ncbi:acyl-CoA synthetase [bacterium SPL81]|nr:acyl-CoA synthetase [Acinetobacter baumannii]
MQGIASLADVIKIEQVGMPKDFPNNTYDLIKQGVAKNPKAIALSFFLQNENYKSPQQWSYQKLFERITQTANFFHGLGADKNTVIAYILPNLPETHFVIWGGQATGIVAAINPLLEVDAITELLNSLNATIIVSLAPFPGTDLWQKISQVIPKVGSIQHVALVKLAHHVSSLKKVPAFFLQKKFVYELYGVKGLKSVLPKNVHLYDFNQSIKIYNKDQLNSQRQISSADYSSFFCTGGTTGLPKIAMRTHANEVNNIWSTAQFLGNSVNEKKSIFCGLPLFHVNAVMVTGLLPFSKGAHVVLGTPQGYRGDGVITNFWNIVEHYKINFFSGVPTLYSTLLQTPIKQNDISSLEYGLCGAAPLAIETKQSFERITNLKILEGYGLTEGTCVSSVNPPLGKSKTGSIGIRIPNQFMKAVMLTEDGDYLRDAEPYEIGAIVISGSNVFSGYHLTEQYQNIWLEIDDRQRWLNTGDLGYQDEDGYFYLTGRKKELIIRGGHNIDPLSIEEPLLQHPDVALVAAIGRPDVHAGELPVAYVQLKQYAKITEAELLIFAKKHIKERAAIPKEILIIDQIPLTAVGKIFKVPLKHQQIKKALKEALDQKKLSYSKLEVEENKNTGLAIRVAVLPNDDQEQIRWVLQQYPFHLDIYVGKQQ